MNGNEVVLAFLAFMGAITTGFFKLISDQNRTHARLSESLDANTKSNQEIAIQTKRAADEAKDRNGHLAELTLDSKKQIIDAVTTINTQHVVRQTVEHETVANKV